VAVLRFENIGGDAANQAFCDGLMVSLTSKLTELEQFHDTLSVVPASDVRREQVASVRDAQRDFNVNLAVTGSVQRVGDHLRLIINLVDARKLKQIRSHESSIPQADAIAMQEGVVRDIADLLQIDLRPEAVQRLAQGSTKVAAAYDSYLRGAGYLLSGKAGLDHGIAEFQRALQLDPRYALAHAGLGEAYWYKYRVTKDRQWVDKAWTECESAIALNSNAAAVHVTMALLKSGTGQYDDAIREAQKALAIDPGEYRAYTELARALDAAGRSPEAEETLKKAIALRPGYWNAHMELGTYYYRHARYDDAEAAYRRVTELVPDNPAGYTNLGVMYHLQGRDAEAERMLKESLRVRPTAFASSNLATVYFFEGHYTEAVGIYEQQISAGANDYMIWGNLADAYRWTPGLAAKAPQAYRTAAQLAQQALAVNPVDSQALSSLALYRAKLGEASAAVQNIEKALRAAPNDKNVLFKAAVVYDIAGKRTEALTYLEMAVKGGYSLNEIAAEPEMRNLRRDARYQALVGSELHRNRNHNQ
jgi:serine/threonine-protein kinase